MRTLVLATLLLGRAAAAEPMPKLPPMVAVKEVTATSTFADKRDAYAAWHALAYDMRWDMGEGVLWSAWCEGKPDEGLGETVTITLAEPTQVDEVQVAAGVWRSDKLFAANNKITALEVIADGKPQTVKPRKKDDWASAPIRAKVTTIAVKVTAVKKGKMNDSCISGINLMRGGETLAPMIGFDPRPLTALPGALSAIQDALSAPDKKGLEPLVEFPFSNHPADGFFMGDPAAVSVKSWKALIAACQKWDKLSDEDREGKATGCPFAVDVDPDDDRGASVTSVGPGTIVVSFPSHREVVPTWLLHFADGRWRLQAIDYE